MNRLLASSNYLLMGDKSLGVEGGGVISAHVYLSFWFALVELLQKKACFWLYHVKPSRGFC